MEMDGFDGSKISKQIRYVVLDQRSPLLSPGDLELQRKLLLFWSNHWSEVLHSLGLHKTLDPSEFLRQHKVTALLHSPSFDLVDASDVVTATAPASWSETEVVAMHLLSTHERREFTVSPYFKNFDPTFLAVIQSSAIRKLLTVQYLAFSSKWQKLKVKPINTLPMVIGSLSMLQMQPEGAQAVASVARRDNGIANALVKMGFHEVLATGNHNATPVSYMLSYSPRIHPHPEVKGLVEFYWESKIEINNVDMAQNTDHGTPKRGKEVA